MCSCSLEPSYTVRPGLAQFRDWGTTETWLALRRFLIVRCLQVFCRDMYTTISCLRYGSLIIKWLLHNIQSMLTGLGEYRYICEKSSIKPFRVSRESCMVSYSLPLLRSLSADAFALWVMCALGKREEKEEHFQKRHCVNYDNLFFNVY